MTVRGRFVLEGIDYEIRTVAEYEALLAVERTSRGLRTLSGGDLAELLNEQDAALAKLDEIRKGQA